MNSEVRGKINIGFLSQFSPYDRKASSGTSYKMAEQLALIGNLHWIPLKLSKTGKLLCRIEKFANSILPKRLMVRMTLLGSKYSYRTLDYKIINNCDIIAAFFCSDIIPHLKTDKPIIYFSDATFPAMINYYHDFSNLWSFNQKQGIQIEKKMINKVDYAVFCSNWALTSAIKDLGGLPHKLKVVELGPNIDEKDINCRIRSYDNSILKLLFIGVDWRRKGGTKAVETCQWLNENGVKAKLSIIGIKKIPPMYENLPYIENVGFLDKNNAHDYIKLSKYINESHILLLPTEKECAGIVFSEAAAFGLPVLTHDTGGISNYVIDNYNGYRLHINATSIDFGKKIQEIIKHKDLKRLSKNSIEFYKQKLNYNNWNSSLSKIISQIKR